MLIQRVGSIVYRLEHLSLEVVLICYYTQYIPASSAAKRVIKPITKQLVNFLTPAAPSSIYCVFFLPSSLRTSGPLVHLVEADGSLYSYDSTGTVSIWMWGGKG